MIADILGKQSLQRSCVRKSGSTGFSLIELLIVIGIISLLVQLALPAIQASREAARRTVCANNLRQVGLATQQLHDVYNKFPPGRWRSSSPTWFVLILPYLDESNAYDLWHLDKKYYHADNKSARETELELWICPSQKSRPSDAYAEERPNIYGAPGDYAGNIGSYFPRHYDANANGIITTSAMWQDLQGLVIESLKKPWDSDVRLAMVLDGASHTILAGEKLIRIGKVGRYPDDSSLYNGDHPHNFGRAGGPALPILNMAERCSVHISGCQEFGSSHPGLCQFVFVDGSVQTLQADIDTEILSRLCDRADGNPIKFNP